MANKFYHSLYTFFWDNLILWMVIFMGVVVVGIVVLEGVMMRLTDDTKESIVTVLKGDGFSEISDVQAKGLFPCDWAGKTGGHNMFLYTAKGNFHGKYYDNIQVCFYSVYDYDLEGSYVSPDEQYWK